MKMNHVIPAFGISNGGCALEFIDRESYEEHARWEAAIELGQVIDPVLPAVMIRIASNGGEPPVFFYEGDERAPTATPKIGKLSRPASPHGSVKDRATIAFFQPSDPLSFVASKVREVGDDFFRKLDLLPPSERPEFLAQHLEPLLISAQLQAENEQAGPRPAKDSDAQHDWSI